VTVDTQGPHGTWYRWCWRWSLVL